MVTECFLLTIRLRLYISILAVSCFLSQHRLMRTFASCQPIPPHRERGPCSPVKRRFADLDSMLRDYITKYQGDAEKELASFRDAHNFDSCVRQAGLARTRKGKLPHQYRIPLDTLRRWAEVLLRKRESMCSCRSFEALFETVENGGRALPGIGELVVYDTALRIGAYLKLEPEEVFLHRGTREGAKALGFDGGRRSIRPDELPIAFRRLKPHEIEDCLCIYKDDLKMWNKPGKSRSTMPGKTIQWRSS